MSDNINYAAPEEGFVAPFPADEESPYIFISYAHEDRELVFPIITRLYEQGWRVWYDQGIPPATNYNEVIASHIAECALFLMFVTQTACERPYVINNEVEYAIRCKPEQIMLCFLEEDIVMPHGADMLLGGVEKPKFPKVEESELESVLAGIEGLTKGEPREAKPFEPDSGTRLVADDGGEYEFVKCYGGVRLTKYLGSDTDIVVPAEYPAGSGQKVVELNQTFMGCSVRTVRVSATVRTLIRAFYECKTLRDVYIPSSVTDCMKLFSYKNWLGTFENTNCTIHCADNSIALDYARLEGIRYRIDNSLAVNAEPAHKSHQPAAYSYISYTGDMRERAAEIIGALKKCNCTIWDGIELSGVEAMRAVRECTCFVALVSREYLEGENVEFLRTAQAMNKKTLVYVLEACKLPPDLSIKNESQQQLRYDSLNEEQRTAKLVEWLQENGCRRASADIPDFEYTATTEDGITLTKYTGSGGNVVIECEYGGIPVTRIGEKAFSGCRSQTSITIPDSVTRIGKNAFYNCYRDGYGSVGFVDFDCCKNITVYCPENSYAWQYCEENGIRHEPLAAAEPGKATEPAAREETLPTTIEEVSAAPAEAPAENPAVTPQESAPTPRKKSPARWLVPLLILLALAAAAGLQVSGVVDILGLLGL